MAKAKNKICPLCGYDKSKPIGVAQEDIPEGKEGVMELTDNGLRGLLDGHLPTNQSFIFGSVRLTKSLRKIIRRPENGL